MRGPQVIPVHLVIRSCGERTEQLCLELARRQLPEGSSAEVVRDVPFERTLRHCYLSGLRSGHRWMLTLDADVLVSPAAVALLLAAAEQMPAHYFQLDGLVLDKITGIHRSAGNRVYRTAMLERAVPMIPAEQTTIRPESHVLNLMAEAGFPSRAVDVPVGLHDFEQAYADIYRTAFVHARKHPSWLRGMMARCERFGRDDQDFVVAGRALADGARHTGPLAIDKRISAELAARALADLGITEKALIADASGMADAFASYNRTTRSAYPPADLFHPKDDFGRRYSGFTGRIRRGLDQFGTRATPVDAPFGQPATAERGVA